MDKEQLKQITDPSIKRKRANGFYWAKWQNVWEVIEWNGYNWLIPGVEDEFYDEQMQQIDENRIINPNILDHGKLENSI